MLRWFGVYILAVWLLLLTTGHLMGGWIHVLPLVVLLGAATRVVFGLVIRD